MGESTATKKRIRDRTATRNAILDAAEAIMVEEGYAAVTSRRLGERAGLKSQLVHYYFESMDDLFVEVYERSANEFLERHLQAAAADNPLRALWELSVHPKRTRLAQEFIALSSHKKAIGDITRRILEQTHRINTAFIAGYLRKMKVDEEEFPAVVISYLIGSLSRSLVNEESMRVTFGHDETYAFAEKWLTRLEAANGSFSQ